MTFFFQLNTVIINNISALPSFVMGVNRGNAVIKQGRARIFV